jgi:acyl carrier protein
MSDVRDRIRTFIIEELQFEGSPDQLTDDYPLLEKGVVDSVGIFQVVSFLEDEYGIEVGDEELVPQHFGTLDGIARLVEAKRGG